MYGAITLYRATFQKLPLTRYWLKGYSPFARRYWGNLGWFLFLWVLRYFSSPSSLLHPILFRCRYRRNGGFPHSEISGSKSVCRLPEAYRRLQRPSSPSAAKASTRCTFMLDHIIQCIVADALCSDHALQHARNLDLWFIQSSYLFIINNVLSHQLLNISLLAKLNVFAPMLLNIFRLLFFIQ